MRNVVLMLAVLVVLSGTVEAQERTWRKDVEPIVQANCSGCHGSNAPVFEEWDLDRDKWTKQNIGPRMDTYAYFMRHVVWPATGSIMRRLDDGTSAPDRKPGNMNGFLGSTDAERTRNLQTIKAWLGEGAWNLNRWSARGNVPAVTKEQLDKIKGKF